MMTYKNSIKSVILLVAISILVVIGIVVVLTTQDETVQDLSDGAEFEIYQDFLASVNRTDSIMKEWYDLTIHSEDDLGNTRTMLEHERKIQNSLYDEYTSLPEIYKTDEKIRSKFADVTNDGLFPDKSFIYSLEHQKEAERDFRITLEHNGCVKTCPVYSVMINGDGTVLYKGLKNVKVMGKQEYEIPIDDLTKFNEFLYDISHGNVDDEYGSQDKTKNTVIITIDFGQVKRIVNHDNSGPESLKQFEEKIKEVAMINLFLQKKELMVR